MDDEKYQKLIDVLSNVEENELEEYEQVKLLFKGFTFPNNKIPEKKNLWFEKDEIRKDSEYYETIIKIIDSFLRYCENKESLKIDFLSKEINDIFENSQFSGYYKCILEISKMFDTYEEYFIEIIRGLLCLGYKKESAINSSFVDSIKEFVLDERIQKSIYSSFLKDIDYQNIDQEFLSNLNSLLSLILNNGKEENVKFIIKKLKKVDESKGQRISSVSTNFENNEEESKYDNNNKSEEESLSTRNNQESSPKSQNFPSITQNSLLYSPSEIKNSPKSNEKASLIVEGINAEINDESNKNSKKITIQNDQQTKKNDSIQENLSE